MPTITIFFGEVRKELDYTLVGKDPDGQRILISKLEPMGDRIVVEVPDRSWIRYLEYGSKKVKFKTQWIQKLVTEDLEYGAIPPAVTRMELPTLQLAAPPSTAPAVPPVFAEETTQFWVDKGYTDVDALLISLWVQKNMATPSQLTIDGIIAPLARPAVPPSPPVPAVPGTLRQQWDDFFKNPDIIKAIGLTPSSIQESFALVFSNYSIINDREQDPEPGDYVSVGLIIAGVTLAVATILWAVMPGAGAAADLSYIEPGLTAGKVSLSGLKGFLSTLKGAALRNPILALLLITQVDIVFWGPSVLRAPLQTSISQATGYKITLETAIRNKDWTVARTALVNLRSQYDNIEAQLDSFPTKFFETVGVQFSDFKTALESGRKSMAAFEVQYPQLVAIPVAFPKKFLLDDVIVEDGDTLMWPGHPEADNRIRIIGIDTHEAETDAGKEEMAYLKTLIENWQVKVLTHQYGDPEKTIDIYGRLLGGVFLGDTDIALAMLEHFGKTILTPTKYQDKYRWIDWDEYKRVAAAAKGPAVREFKIYIDSIPSNAKLYVDGKYTRHLTPSDEVELADVMDMLAPGRHIIMAQKGGLEGSQEVDIVEGANPDVLLTLLVAGLQPAEPEPVVPIPGPPVEPSPEAFSISVLSAPSRAKLHIDGVYTHHLTPSNAKELSDVMHLLTPGMHTFKATKSGREASKDVEIVAGVNEPIFLSLDIVGLPISKEDLQKQIEGTEAALAELKAQLAKL